jgi:hypothetical protein
LASRTSTISSVRYILAAEAIETKQLERRRRRRRKWCGLEEI